MSKGNSKVTIASAVIAGLAISDRLNELEIKDEKLFHLIGELAGSLGAVMATTEKLDMALEIMDRAAQRDDLLCLVEGIDAVRPTLSELVSDQDKIMEAMLKDVSPQEALLIKLMAEINKFG